MATETTRAAKPIDYEASARAYLEALKPEHFMEATPQATQRAISLASFALVTIRRPEVKFYNELLVQYPFAGLSRPAGVVPDNMVVVHPEPVDAIGSFDVARQTAKPFMVLEYVSKSSKRKDYDDNMERYELHLQVPYYLIFYPENQELTLYRHNGVKYVTVLPNQHGRYPIPELEMEAAILDGWVRFWFRGELLPLPAELQSQLDETRRQLKEEMQRTDEANRQLAEANRRNEEVNRQLTEATHRSDEMSKQLTTERTVRQTMADELTRLRAELERLQRGS